MSLTKPPVITPEKLAANRANGRRSRGPATPEGLERTRESKVQHGFYAHPPTEALRALGEDPEEFERLLESLEDTWQPADQLQSRLVERLARALWRLERSDRVQESMAVRRVREMSRKLESGVAKTCKPYEDRLVRLEELAQALTAGEEYVTSQEEFDLFDAVYGAEPEGRAEEILVLLTRLLEPPAPVEGSDGSGGESIDPPEREAEAGTEGESEEGGQEEPETDDDNGDSDTIPLPDVPIAIGAERAEVLEQLGALLDGEIEAAKAALDREHEAVMQYKLPLFRDSAIAPSLPKDRMASRVEDSSFRQVTRLTDLLLKLKKREAAGQEQKDEKIENEGRTHDVDENKGPDFGTHDVDENE